jgi:hypothetical protein
VQNLRISGKFSRSGRTSSPTWPLPLIILNI